MHYRETIVKLFSTNDEVTEVLINFGHIPFLDKLYKKIMNQAYKNREFWFDKSVDDYYLEIAKNYAIIRISTSGEDDEYELYVTITADINDKFTDISNIEIDSEKGNEL